MKILLVNKFYYLLGGPETCLFAMKELLEKKGHNIISFSMKHPGNIPSPQKKYFVEQIDLSDSQSTNNFKKIRTVFKIIYSFEAKRKISELINDEKPEIAHFHNIYHQLTPSIITPLYKAGIPIVMTLHDLNLVCLNYQLLNNGRICEACKRQQFWRAIPARCVKGSLSKTLVDYIAYQVHRILRLYDKISLFITPSEFMRQQHIKMGMEPNRLKTIENFIDITGYEPNYEDEGYILYFGRISKEKGVETLVRALSLCPNIPLKITGSGIEENIIKELVAKLGLKNIEFTGFKRGKDLDELIRNSKFTVFPSELRENCPMAILESFAYGKPVIGTEIGGIPEQIINGKNGFLFEPGNAGKLAELIRMLYKDRNLIRQMGMEARKTVEIKYSSERHYAQLMAVYDDLLNRNGRK